MKSLIALVMILGLHSASAQISRAPAEKMPLIMDAKELDEAAGHFGLELRKPAKTAKVSDKERLRRKDDDLLDDAHHQDSASAGAAGE